MGGDSAESAPAEASAVKADRETDHVECRDALSLVARMRKTGVGHIESPVYLLGSHRRIHGVDFYHALPVALP